MVTKGEAENIIAIKEARDAEKAQRMEVASRIKSLIDESGKAEKTKEGKTLYNKYLVETEGLKINKATASHYLHGNEPISMENIIKISNHFGCCVEYLMLKSDTKRFEFDSVAKSLGLTESVVETLQTQKKLASDFNVAGAFLDTINLLVDSNEGINLIESIMVYRNTIRRKHNAHEQYIEGNGIDPKWISNSAYFAHKMDSLESFSEEIKKYSFSEGELTDEQIEGLYHYQKEVAEIEDINYQAFKCNSDLVRFLDFIKDAETEGTTTQAPSLLRKHFKTNWKGAK